MGCDGESIESLPTRLPELCTNFCLLKNTLSKPIRSEGCHYPQNSTSTAAFEDSYQFNHQGNNLLSHLREQLTHMNHTHYISFVTCKPCCSLTVHMHASTLPQLLSSQDWHLCSQSYCVPDFKLILSTKHRAASPRRSEVN